MNSKVLLCPLTWSPIDAEPGAGISVKVWIVIGQSSCMGQNLVEMLASWSGSRQTKVPGAQLHQMSCLEPPDTGTKGQIEITPCGRLV